MKSIAPLAPPVCSNCGGFCLKYFRTADYNRRISNRHFLHYRCKQCGLLFIHPVPSDLGLYYPGEYYHIPDSLAFLEENYSHERYKVELIQRFRPSGRLLEIGPSLGTFAFAAKRAGYEVAAIEMSAACSRYLNEIVQIPTVNTMDTVAALEAMEPFDVIALWHVIEHLVDPWAAFTAIANRLTPGGICVLAAPNPEAFQFKVMGRWWPHVDTPRHLFLIPQTVLIKRAEVCGLRLEFVTTDDEGTRGWNTFGWEFFLGNLARHPRISRMLRRVGRMLARVMRPFDRREGYGSAYTLVFRKIAL